MISLMSEDYCNTTALLQTLLRKAQIIWIVNKKRLRWKSLFNFHLLGNQMISTCHLFLTSKHNYPRSPSECSSGLLWNHKLASQGHFHSGVGWVVDLWLRRRSASFAFHQDKIFSPLCEISSLWHCNFLSRESISQDAQPEPVSSHLDSRSRLFALHLASKHTFRHER